MTEARPSGSSLHSRRPPGRRGRGARWFEPAGCGLDPADPVIPFGDRLPPPPRESVPTAVLRARDPDPHSVTRRRPDDARAVADELTGIQPRRRYSGLPPLGRGRAARNDRCMSWYLRVIEQPDGRWSCRRGSTCYDAHDQLVDALRHLHELAADLDGTVEFLVHHHDTRPRTGGRRSRDVAGHRPVRGWDSMLGHRLAGVAAAVAVTPGR